MATPKAKSLLNDQPIDPAVVPRLLGDVKAEPFTPERAETGLQNLQRLVGNLTTQAVPANRSVRHHVEVWTRQELAAKKSTARKKMNVHFLSFFAKRLGDVEIAVIEEGRWADYFAWVQGRDWSEDYKGRLADGSQLRGLPWRNTRDFQSQETCGAKGLLREAERRK